MRHHAADTNVSIEKTRYEIERTLRNYGADQFSYGTDDSRGLSVIRFRAQGRTIQFTVYMPAIGDAEFTKTPTGKQRDNLTATKMWEQACRQRWRALLLCIKAKMESVESGIEEFEEAFLPHIMLPDGRTAGEWLRPQLALAYETKTMPRDLLALPAPNGRSTP